MFTAVEGRRESFTPFVVSVNRVLDVQYLMDEIALKSHSEVMGWVHARMVFAILHATNLCLHGSRVKWRSGHGMDDGSRLPHFFPDANTIWSQIITQVSC